VCISPLSAIMIEQTEKFNTMGIKTEFIGEAQVNPCSQRRVLNGEARPGLTDCGALGKKILGGPQIKVKTKKKKKKVTATSCSHCTPINNIPTLTLQQNNLGRLQCSTRIFN